MNQEEEQRKCEKCGKVLHPHKKGKLCQPCFDDWKAEKIARGEWSEEPPRRRF